LRRVYKEASHNRPFGSGKFPRAPDQRQMSFMQSAHGRHENHGAWEFRDKFLYLKRLSNNSHQRNGAFAASRHGRKTGIGSSASRGAGAVV
jgi:hypothetical protein